MALMLGSILGLVALGDLVLEYAGSGINQVVGWDFEWSLKGIAGYIFYPFILAIGIPPADAGIVSDIIGERLIVTEVQSYMDLSKAISSGVLQHPRSIVVTTYALCGFAHIASLAIFIGGICQGVDYTKVDLTRLRVGDNNTGREVVVYVVLENRAVCFRFIMTKSAPRIIEVTEGVFVPGLVMLL